MSDDKIVKTIRGYQRKIKCIDGLDSLMGIAIMIAFAVFVFLFVYMVALSYKPIYFGMIMAFFVVLLMLFWVVGKQVDRLQKKMKQFIGEHVVKYIIAERITIQEYKPHGCFDRDFLSSSGALPDFSQSYGSDYIKGIYRGKEIIYCDIKLERKGNDGTFIVFKGSVVSLPLGRPLVGKRVRILEKGSKPIDFIENAYINAETKLYRALGIKKGEEQTVTLESVEFNNQFEVKATDEELAFYILTPQFMENIVSADRLAEGRTNICVGSDRVDIAIHNNYDAFEFGNTMKNKKQLEESRARMRADLNKILSVVDEILKKDKLF
ncbi:MAG: DUF3137 domain-containing protein [Lachnospiraceae bacterium]|nr:DUF3137 domain-containing protein [Lachnospiraceae bacterium]